MSRRPPSGPTALLVAGLLGAGVFVAPAAAPPGTDRGPAPAAERPTARAHHQLVRHEADGRVWLIGGSTPGEEGHRTFDDVWAWEEDGWRRRGSLPFPRSSHRVVYSPSRASLLLFGGTDGGPVRADSVLRERRDGAWEAVASAAGAATGEPGACWDRRRDRLVLYGGARADGSYASSTWEWGGGPLERVATEGRGPGARLGHALFWDPVGERCLLFGGRDAAGRVLGDTWSWDGARWRELEVQGPRPRWIHAATADPTRRRALLFGGQTAGGGLLGDTWAWDGSGWRRVSAAGPPPRMMGRMAPLPEGILLFGGRGAAERGARTAYADRGDTWRLGEGGWELLAEGPGAAGGGLGRTTP